MSPRPVIFLDFHGVIMPDGRIFNEKKIIADFLQKKGVLSLAELSADQMIELDSTEIDSRCLAFVNNLVREFDAGVVVSSSLRGKILFRELVMQLKFAGAEFTPCGVTPVSETDRHSQVMHWLQQYRSVGFTNFVCLDDRESWTGIEIPQLVLVDNEVGIQAADYDKARNILLYGGA